VGSRSCVFPLLVLKVDVAGCDILPLGDGDILTQGLIELIKYLYQQSAFSFLEAYLERTSKLSVLGLEQFGWVIDRKVFSGAHE
jgi:hypothetical protein